MITLRQLRYLAALAQHRHFGRAAEACAVTQPALSMQIRDLEKELGIALISSRSPRWVKSGNGLVVGFGNLTGALRVRLVEGGRYESDSEQQPTPSPRIKPGNIAYAAVFLASEESRMITGHILPVDRSWTEGLATEAQLLIENGPSR